jgi:hypothetical protein
MAPSSASTTLAAGSSSGNEPRQQSRHAGGDAALGDPRPLGQLRFQLQADCHGFTVQAAVPARGLDRVPDRMTEIEDGASPRLTLICGHYLGFD